MADALSAAVTGLKAHQMMLDVAGNNLSNINTAGYKAGRITFSELLGETIQRASGPTGSIGGVNPQQLGGGVGVANISRNLSQGSFESTGKELDLAISGEGYFVTSDGSQNLYTRIGSFTVDEGNVLVDSNGNRVQRYGTVGESAGFQSAGDNSIHIPYDVALPANPTSTVKLVGNLKATSGTPVSNTILSSSAFTTSTGTGFASVTDLVTNLAQFTAGTGGDPGGFGVGESGTIRVQGTMADGTTAVDHTFTIDGSSRISDILNGIEAAFGGSVTATMDQGKIQIKDSEAGYSRTAVSSVTYETASSGGESLSFPSYFNLVTAGGEDSQNFSINVFDQLGGQHVMRGTFAKTDTPNTWDIVIMSVSGEIEDYASYDRRIEGVQFNEDGSLAGLQDSSETKSIDLRFQSFPATAQQINFEIGTDNELNGLTQSDTGENSTAGAKDQDGYGLGTLSGLSVNNEGKLVGTFSNGEKKDVAAIQLAIFGNPEGLEAVGDGYYISTENSGEAVQTMALNGGAGSIQGQKLEKSNVNSANEFVSLMQAQNGFQANARTIKIANEVLQELTNLIR